MNAFIIGTTYQKLAVRYVPNQYNENVDYLILECINLFNQRKYEECINKTLNALSYLMKLKKAVKLYEILGLSYIYLNKKDANLYLEIADGINEKLGKDCFSSTEDEDLPQISINEFDYNNYYGIENIDKIAQLLSGTELSIHEVCAKFNLSLEQECTVYLILIRDAYINENYATGDDLAKELKQIKNKSIFVRYKLRELEQNKYLYKNRKEGYQPLIIKPI